MDGLPSGASHDPLQDGAFETLCEHYAEHRLAQGGAAAPPLYQTSTFVYPDAEAFERRDLPQSPYYDYSRRSNPTTALLEAKLAKLERGEWARCFGSGMGAITAAVNMVVSSGAHVVAAGHCYSPTHRYLEHYLKRFDVQVTFVPGLLTTDFMDAIRDETCLLYLESPTSGQCEILDIRALTALAAERGITTIFDNSWATPVFQNPLDYGVDMVVHSLTKYISGHSDVLGGVIVGRDPDLGRTAAAEGEMLGATLDPHAAWLLLRGLRTLPIRMRQHHESGLHIAKFLAEHPAVRQVNHPGLESHPQHALARQQLRGYGSLFSFALHDQSRAATHRFLNRLQIFSLACSWGGFESLALGGLMFDFDHDAARAPWLIRLYVGLEGIADLENDVRQALEGLG